MGFNRYKLTRRVINDLKKRSTIGIVFYLVIVCIVVFSDGYYTRHPEFSMQFLFLIACICLFRFFHLPISAKTQEKFETLNNRVFLLSVVLTGLIWGIGFAKFMVQAGEPKAMLLMVMCTSGLCAGGVVAFIPDLRLSMSFSFFMLVPAMITMGVRHLNTPLAAAILLFLIYLCFMALRGNREYWDALENEYLLEEKSRDLERMSRIDGLTKLNNRRYFDEVFTLEWNRACRNQTPLSIVICDIDKFKSINDRFGHLAGDEYLKALAGLLKKIFRRNTDITARYGGEEFIVLMSGESLENAFIQAEKIRAAVHLFQLEYDEKLIRTTISSGVSTCIPQKDASKEGLISKADKALYESKTGGRNRTTKMA